MTSTTPAFLEDVVAKEDAGVSVSVPYFFADLDGAAAASASLVPF
jgi:hypothetical protein